MQVSPSTAQALAAIERAAIDKPLIPAIVEPGGYSLTYGELWRAIGVVRNQLQAAGIAHADVAVVLMQPGLMAALAVAGVVHHCCCAPLNPNLTSTEIESHLIGMRCKAILLTPEFTAAREIALRLGITVFTVAAVEDFGASWTVERSSQDAVSTQTQPLLDMPVDTAILLNTSATTGQSKLVPLTRANLNAMAESTYRALEISAQDRLLLITPLYHAQGIVSSFAQFLAQGTILATGGFDAAAYPGWLEELRPTWYTCAPAIHQAVVTVLENRSLRKPHSLRFVRSSGAAFTPELAKQLGRLLGVPVLNGYGMSETGAVTSDPLNLRPYKPGSVGRSVGPTIAIMHSSGALLAPGEEGEIVVRGPQVMTGYANNVEANRTAFREGWFRTGDLGRLDSDGFLFITGRSKEMINRGGQKIVPDEVDAVFEAHPAVLEAVAFAVPHPTLGEDIACAVVPDPSANTNEAELRRFASQKLAPFKVPRRIFFVDRIPRGETGKPKRHQLAEQIARNGEASRRAGNELASAFESGSIPEAQLPDPDSNPTFRRLIEIWARVLKRDDIELAEDFFTAGGDSLGAVNLLAEIDLRFGSDLQGEAARFLDSPTLAQVAMLLSESNASRTFSPATSEIEVFPVTEQTDLDPIYCIPGDGDEGLYFRRLATHLAGRLPLSIVRPVNTWHERSLYEIEEAAERTVAAIQQVQPEGPFTIGGYCYGGIVAFAAAGILRRSGHDVKLVLFDVPAPGFPTMVRGVAKFVERAALELRQMRLKSGIRKPAVNFRRLIRRAAWFAIRPVKHALARFEQFPAVKLVIDQAQQGYLPLYRPRPIDVPALHFLSIEEYRPIRSASRLAWGKLTTYGMTEHWVPMDHDHHFRESNLHQLSETIANWCSQTDGCQATAIGPAKAPALATIPESEPIAVQVA